MKLVFYFFLGMAFSVCMQSCDGEKKVATSNEKKPATTTTSSKVVTITRENNGETISVKLGEKFDVRLNECRGCADMWQLSQANRSSVSLLSATYSNISCTDCTGGTQDKTFHFETRAKGNAELNFKYFEAKFSVIIAVY